MTHNETVLLYVKILDVLLAAKAKGATPEQLAYAVARAIKECDL